MKFLLACAFLAPQLIHSFFPRLPHGYASIKPLMKLAMSEEDSSYIEDHEARGLLFSMEDLSQERFFGVLGISAENLLWLDEPDLFWSAAVADAMELGIASPELYIAKVSKGLQTYLDSTVRIEELDPQFGRYLEQASKRRGQFTHLLGGPHGKSRAVMNRIGRPWMETFEGEDDFDVDHTHFPVFINMAAGKNETLAEAVSFATTGVDYFFGKQEVLQLAKSEEQESLVKDLFGAIERGDNVAIRNDLEQMMFMEFPPETPERVFEIVQSFKVDNARFQKGGLELGIEVDRMMTIGLQRNKDINMIIDKAERFLPADDPATMEMLQCLLYRGQKNLNVFLISSDLKYRWELLRNTGLDPCRITNVLIAGDRSPSQIWNLMVNSKYTNNMPIEGVVAGKTILGFGPRLAKLLIAAYGGHLETVENVLADLAIEKQDFFASSRLPVHLSDGIEECLKVEGARDMLMELAIQGFVPLKSNPVSDKAVDAIAMSGVAGVVSCNDKVTGLPPGVWRQNRCKYGLVPTLQSTRIVIADTIFAIENPTPIPDTLIPDYRESVLVREPTRKTTAWESPADASWTPPPPDSNWEPPLNWKSSNDWEPVIEPENPPQKDEPPPIRASAYENWKSANYWEPLIEAEKADRPTDIVASADENLKSANEWELVTKDEKAPQEDEPSPIVDSFDDWEPTPNERPFQVDEGETQMRAADERPLHVDEEGEPQTRAVDERPLLPDKRTPKRRTPDELPLQVNEPKIIPPPKIGNWEPYTDVFPPQRGREEPQMKAPPSVGAAAAADDESPQASEPEQDEEPSQALESALEEELSEESESDLDEGQTQESEPDVNEDLPQELESTLEEDPTQELESELDEGTIQELESELDEGTIQESELELNEGPTEEWEPEVDEELTKESTPEPAPVPQQYSDWKASVLPTSAPLPSEDKFPLSVDPMGFP